MTNTTKVTKKAPAIVATEPPAINEVATKEVEIKTKECTTGDGKKFLAYKALTKTGKYIDCKFRKEVKAPSADCIIVVDVTKMNVTNNTKYATLWVAEIIDVIYKDNAEATIKDIAKVNEIF